MGEATKETMDLLPGYRVLDLSEGGSMFCGKMFGDYGADVIKMERVGGSPSRIPPFIKDVPDPEKSLFWLAHNVNKRGITLNLELREGQELFKKLVSKADFVIESFATGYLDKLGLGYKELSKINPRVILTSITPYGQTGPHADYKAYDINCWGMGGYMWLIGDADRAPLQISLLEQSYINGGAEGAAASLIAHWRREKTGEGQHVDVSVQERVIWLTCYLTLYWDVNKFNLYRCGGAWALPNVAQRLLFPCKDGYVVSHIWGGGDRTLISSSTGIVKWMDEEGMAPDWLKTFDWMNDFAAPVLTIELIERVYAPIMKFLHTKTKKEIMEQAVKRGLIMAPVSNVQDLWNDEHLRATDFWVKSESRDFDKSLVYPSLGVRIGHSPFKVRRRAPRIGEHNKEIYGEELGLPAREMASLKRRGVI